jgi:hypothetical protein
MVLHGVISRWQGCVADIVSVAGVAQATMQAACSHASQRGSMSACECRLCLSQYTCGCLQAEADFRELVQSVDSLQLATQPQHHVRQPQHEHREPQSPPQPGVAHAHASSNGSQPSGQAAGHCLASPSTPSSDEQQRRQQQQHDAQVQAEAARLAADNAALRGRLAKTHQLIGAMQVPVSHAAARQTACFLRLITVAARTPAYLRPCPVGAVCIGLNGCL